MFGGPCFRPPLAGGYPSVVSQLTKQGQRFLSSVTVEHPSPSLGFLRKFVSSSSKHVALTTLSHLLSLSTSTPRLSSIVLPLYTVIKQESWFCWNSKLSAHLIAFVHKEGMVDEAEKLFAETVLILESRPRDMCIFLSHLIVAHGNHKSHKGVLDSCSKLRNLMLHSSSGYVKRKGYDSVIAGFCTIGLPNKAMDLMEEMRVSGVQPTLFVYRSVVYGYGQLGFLQEMKRTITKMEEEGCELDTVCRNMVLSSFGEHGEFLDMVSWLEKMRESEIPCSIRTYNSVLNSCPNVMLMMQDVRNLPVSIDEVVGNLGGIEGHVVRELLKSSILDEAMEWKCTELRLDLHGMHMSTAYLVLLQWFDELRQRFAAGDSTTMATPAEVLVICGCGRHSSTRGESPVRNLVKEILFRMKCPLRIDRKNVGCFIGKGKSFRDWLMP